MCGDLDTCIDHAEPQAGDGSHPLVWARGRGLEIRPQKVYWNWNNCMCIL